MKKAANAPDVARIRPALKAVATEPKEANAAVENTLPGLAGGTPFDNRPLENDPVPSGPAAAAAIKTYRAEFFTAADYASRDFAADTPEQALQLARRFYDEDIGELDFRSNDDNAGLDLIQIWDSKRGTLATWESDEYRLRNAAPELLAALNRILPRYADFLSRAGADLKACEDYQTAKAAVVRASPIETQ
jgi:hypothetical protein